MSATLAQRTFSVSPIAIAASVVKNRQLIWQLAKRDVVGRYRGSLLGLFWSLVHPLLMLAVYTFVFGVVFRSRWGAAEPGSKLEFSVILFAGLIVFGIFSEFMNRAPGLVLANPNYVKKVVFPLEVLPWVLLASAIFHALVSIAVLIVMLLIAQGYVPWTMILLPVVLMPLIFLCLGLGWFLSSWGVFVRDVGQIVGVLTSALLFLSPLFFPSSALPENIRPLIRLNPLSFPLEQAREVMLWGHMPNWEGLLLYGGVCFVIMWLSFAWFQKTRRGFADVI
jgi:lipopolysaccharide transport system permease protein